MLIFVFPAKPQSYTSIIFLHLVWKYFAEYIFKSLDIEGMMQCTCKNTYIRAPLLIYAIL